MAFIKSQRNVRPIPLKIVNTEEKFGKIYVLEKHRYFLQIQYFSPKCMFYVLCAKKVSNDKVVWARG